MICRNADDTKTTEKSEAAMRLAEFCFFVNIDCRLFDQWSKSDVDPSESQLSHLLRAFGVLIHFMCKEQLQLFSSLKAFFNSSVRG